MPGPPNTKDFKQNNVYTQKVVVKQANKAQLSEQQELQKQRLLPTDSPRGPADSPRNSLQLPPQRLQQLSTAVTTPRAQLSQVPTQQQQPQQSQTQALQPQTQIQTEQLQQQQQQSATWQWQPQQPNVYPPPSPQPPAVAPWLQNGAAEGTPQLQRQPSPRPMSAPAPQSSLTQTQANDANQEGVFGLRQNGSLTSVPARPRTATVTASPRVTNEEPLIGNSQGPKSVQWQDAQGNDLCQYREFDPSEQGDTDEDEEQWHSQKKGCCAIM